MDRNEARSYMQQKATSYFQPDRSKRGFICPICGSGSGKNGTGITTKDGIHFTCWAGCFTNADIIDIIGMKNGLTDYVSKLQATASEFGITLNEYHADEHADGYRRASKNFLKRTENNVRSMTVAVPDEAEPDYTDFFLQAHKNIGETTYYRGLSLATINRFNIGYVKNWVHPKANRAPSSPRLIIPTSKGSYLARDTRSELTDEQKKYGKVKVGNVKIFNCDALYTSRKPVFVVEGEFDAMSVVDVGGEAVALGSVSNRGMLLSMLEKSRPFQPIIVALDNDDAGRKASEDIANGLKRLNLPFCVFDIAQPYKDANEALNADREGFMALVGHAERAAVESKIAELENFRKESVLYCLQSFWEKIAGNRQEVFVPTGFDDFDSILDGGLYAGLYVVGAITSLGKTTFCLQIADYVAASGHDVLIFSLEMSRDELVAKSISRLTFVHDIQRYHTTAHAKTVRGILTGTRYAGYGQTETDIIREAISDYERYAGNIYITEGIGNVGVDEIRSKVQRHFDITGKVPIVVVDYLQIISPVDIRATDKQNTDKAVLELKRLSRDYGVPVLGISSFNRDNYTAPVNLSSFKESGAIEYSSDVLIGLQYDGMDYLDGEADKAREKRIRELVKQSVIDGSSGRSQRIQIKVLKNRNGSKGSFFLDFYPMFNFFEQPHVDNFDEDVVWSKSESNYK